MKEGRLFVQRSQLPPMTVRGPDLSKGSFRGVEAEGGGYKQKRYSQSAVTVILKLVLQWSDQHHPHWLVQLIFSSRVDLFSFPWGQFSALWQLMSWIQSGQHVVHFFHLVGSSVSTALLTGYGYFVYSPWGGTKRPWLCLMTKLLLFGLVWLFSFASAFLHFSD